MNRLTKGYLICLIGTLIWSSTGVLIRYLTEFGLPPLVLAFWRDLFVAGGLGLGLWLLKPDLLRVERRHWRFILGYGLVLAVFNTLWTLAVALNGAAVATVLVYGSPIFTALLSWRFFNEKVSYLQAGLIGLSLIGTLLVAGAYDPAVWRLNPWGLLIGVLPALLFAVYSLLGRAAAKRELNSWSLLFYAFGLAALVLFGFNALYDGWRGVALFSEMLWLGRAWEGWFWLLLLGLGPSIGGYGLYTLSLAYLPGAAANLVATLEPAFTLVLAYLALGERLTPAQAAGSLLLLAAVLLLRLSESRPPKAFAI